MNEYSGDLDQFTRRQEVEGPCNGYRGVGWGSVRGREGGDWRGERTSPMEDSIDVLLIG